VHKILIFANLHKVVFPRYLVSEQGIPVVRDIGGMEEFDENYRVKTVPLSDETLHFPIYMPAHRISLH